MYKWFSKKCQRKKSAGLHIDQWLAVVQSQMVVSYFAPIVLKLLLMNSPRNSVQKKGIVCLNRGKTRRDINH